MKKWISIIVIVILAVGGGIWFFQSRQTATPVSAQAMTTTVQKGNIQVEVSGSGTVASINSSDITADLEGEVEEVLVEVNDVVEEGDEIITFTDGSDPITAAHAGTITTIDVESGSRIQNSQVVGHITDYETLETVISVDELDITKMKAGQNAEITASAFPDETFEGTVTEVSKEGTAENGVSSFSVTVQLKDPKSLLIGMSTEVNVITERKQDVLYVPIESVQVNGEEKYVTIQEAASSNADASTSDQVVETGINDDQNIEIISGLTEGQTIELPVTTTSGNESTQELPGAGREQGFPGSGSGQGFPSGGGGQMMPGGTGRGNE
ncbi:efflux RND transporter periplasmic adaptor subunit [Metabacillus halosaccharovorans]|uniref:HlyD family efflux transporter periplasmic adaptor subunit n=1 Tax=Metabacillus halosaccharovorans TaxID=930124 RepID=A0ABT3DN90_9BACI|nr:HlyD family efflux transporter periplasmic adaptor subunit [Metabacillus halosaccharovorans]MCV9888517.1 HlyD family efflux transporter periplasmic adaptor subunit [Metabacillus halosaccharovorans]